MSSQCDLEIFENGKPVAALDARSADAEEWVQAVAKQAGAKVDWHFSGGVAQVLHLGDADSRARVMQVITELADQLNGSIMWLFEEGAQGLHRSNITPTPPNAIASFYTSGEGSTFIVE